MTVKKKPETNNSPVIIEDGFYDMIHGVIAGKRHVSYLRGVLKNYEKYKVFFVSAFTTEKDIDNICLFRVTYSRSSPFWQKVVWREFEVFSQLTFCDLAESIIWSMDWQNDHMHGFNLRDPEKKQWYFFDSRYTFYAPGWEDDPHPTYKSDQIRINDIDYAKNPKLRFLFDYGDGHEFEIEFKSSRKKTKADSRVEFPLLVDQRGVAPNQYP